ncbi:MAG: hypothetical protein KatS3mg111_3479 [Pirellulaceae bacterium]|nr:MAG: hypothetical protein KatS3mg111_3479 [Pirellulaceae bacterium]
MKWSIAWSFSERLRVGRMLADGVTKEWSRRPVEDCADLSRGGGGGMVVNFGVDVNAESARV